jgi:DNA modification methylase
VSRYTIHTGNCRASLESLPERSVQTCITSPPYYGLRDYGHDGQIGLEDTPEAYVAKMVEVFREVRRVLRDDGTLWLNIGDSYFSTTKGSGGSNPETSPKQAWKGSDNGQAFKPIRLSAGDSGLKPKDLIGIPWMLAFALRADGWYLRQDIIWHKPNPMPESVTDRCTKAHEYVFLLSKSERYYFDAEAIKEPSVSPNSGKSWSERKAAGEATRHGLEGAAAHKSGGYASGEKRNRRSVWSITTTPFKGAHFAVMPEALVEPCVLAGSKVGDTILDPFTGSGTVAVVALRHGRNFVGCELNPAYVEIAENRIAEATRQQVLV